MFLNLYFLRDAAFLDHNFSDFCNYDGGGPPIEREDSTRITAYLRRSYRPDSRRPGRLEGLPPDFNPIVAMTLSMPCCGSFIRANPGLPITPRDYYLSKLFQFTYDALIERFDIDLSNSGLRMELHDLFERIPNDLLPPNDQVPMEDVWWAFYEDTLANSLAEVIRLLDERLTGILKRRVKVRQPGPRPAVKDHKAVATVVHQITIAGRDWLREIRTVCSALDKRNVPCSQGRDRKTKITWIAKLTSPGGEGKVTKAIQYRLKEAAKLASPSN